jgi:N-acetylglucosaminyl-diphospho-decaprenol L-rhamnosyltransferase
VPQAVVNHQAGHSSGRSAKVAFHKAYHKGQSRVYAMQKHGVPNSKYHFSFEYLATHILFWLSFTKRKREAYRGLLKGLKEAKKWKP